MSSATPAGPPGQVNAAVRAGLIVPPDAELRQIDFDQFLRYSAAVQHLDRLLQSASGHVRILEVGPNVLNLLPRFLDSSRVHVTRCDVITTFPDDPDFVLIEKGKPLPFSDGHFDAVISLEVLEHIPRPERAQFLAECLRVSRQGAVFTCPNGTSAVEVAESVAAGAYFARHGAAHPFLGEHTEFGLPRETEVREILMGLGVVPLVDDNAPLNAWLVTLLQSEVLVERNAPEGVSTLLTQLVQLEGAAESRLPYRKVYVCPKGSVRLTATGVNEEARASTPSRQDLKEQRTALVAKILTLLQAKPVRSRDLLRRLQSQFAEASRSLGLAMPPESETANVLRELQADLTRASESIRQLAGELARTRAVATGTVLDRPRSIRARLGDWRQAVLERVSTTCRALRRGLCGAKFTAADLLPLQEIVSSAQPDVWKTTGNQAQLLLPCELDAGPIQLNLLLRSARSGRVSLALDTGGHFDERDQVELGTIGGEFRLKRHLTLQKPVSALRLDVTDVAELRVLQFEIEQFPAWFVFLMALRQKVARARQNGGWRRVLRSAARVVLRRQTGWLRETTINAFEPPKPPRDAQVDYLNWRKQNQLTAADRSRLEASAITLANPPLISLLLPLGSIAVAEIRSTVESLQGQIYPHWELQFVCSPETQPETVVAIRELMASNPRIQLSEAETTGDAAACNAALSAATGEYVALLSPGDRLAEHALSLMVERIVASGRQVDMLYSDEDQLNDALEHTRPFFKPDWSPEYLLAVMYTQNLGVYRTKCLRDLGGFRNQFDGAHAYDVALRIAAHSGAIEHIAEVLYHRRMRNISAERDAELQQVARRALEAHLQATRQNAAVESGPVAGMHRVRFAIAGDPLVSIVIPSACGRGDIRGRKDWFVRACVESIRQKSSYSNYEIVVLDNNDMPPALRQALEPFRVRHVPYTQPFNLASKMNLGAEQALGQHLVFLNDDIEVISADWLQSMLEFSQNDEIGCVGVKLLFPDGRLQHVGVTILAGSPIHPFYLFPREHTGYHLSNVAHRNYSAVTGACMMTRADVFRELGGFHEGFPLNYNDVDYCLRVRESGRRIVYTPYATLYHHESVTKSGTYADELTRFKQRWGSAALVDPYYNPNLSVVDADFSVGVSRAA